MVEIARHILLDILGPILFLVLLGAWLRWKFKIDLGTLSKLNIYCFLPAFVFEKVSTSTLNWDKMAGIMAICLAQVATLAVVVWGVGWLLRVRQQTLAAIAMAVMFYNSGNYGLPLADLAYPGRGAAVQTFVMLTQNVLTWTVGVMIAAWAGTGDVSKGLIKLLRMPVFPTLAAALIGRWYCDGDGMRLPIVVRAPAAYLSNGMVAIALVTLGAQLASNPRWPRWRPVSLALVLRLLFGPIQMAGLLWAFHWCGWSATDLWPWPAALLIVTASTPTAVNTLLLTLELGGDTNLAADCVFWSTILSCVTITGWLIVMKVWFPC
jgi:predicted permease